MLDRIFPILVLFQVEGYFNCEQNCEQKKYKAVPKQITPYKTKLFKSF